MVRNDKDETPRVVPRLSIEWPDGIETRYSFDAAWAFARSCPIPNTTRFLGWVREADVR